MAYNPSYASVSSSTNAYGSQNTQTQATPAYLSNLQPRPPLYQSNSSNIVSSPNNVANMQQTSYYQPQQHSQMQPGPQQQYQPTQNSNPQSQYQSSGQYTNTSYQSNIPQQQQYQTTQQYQPSTQYQPPSANISQNSNSQHYQNSQSYDSSNQHDWFEQYYNSLDAKQLTILKAWFQSVDTDNSGAIDQRELSLMKMPGVGPFTGSVLGIEAASQLIKLFDKDKSGVIEFKEYAALHCFMDKMNTSFFHADSDQNGILDRGEIGLALDKAGFKVSPQVTDMFYQKYNTGKGLDFVKFMRMASDIALVKSKFHWLDNDNDGRLDLDQVLRLCAELNPITQVVYAAQSSEIPKTETGCVIA